MKSAFSSEAAFRQETVLLAIGIPIVLILDVSSLAQAAMIGSLILILLVEIINTAIETVIERISPEIHPLSKKAKDLGSAAVFLAILHACVIWTINLVG